MPIQSPRLDDIDYARTVERLRARIPIYAPEWTDHNDSDPGITLIQLFAHLAEQIGYRLNQVPQKNYLEFLKLIGIRLRPAESARTLMNFVLTRPETLEQFLIPAGSRVKAKSDAGEPPVFETDVDLDVVPAQIAALVTTTSRSLTQINGPSESGPAAGEDPEDYIAERFSLAWDGKTPKLKDMPLQPVPLFTRPDEVGHKHLWIGLAFNPSVTASFLGARVTLTLQLDDDEQPMSDAVAECGVPESEIRQPDAPDADLVDYRYYRPPEPHETAGSWQKLAIIGDGTDGWSRSGTIRFDVPTRMGPIPDAEWQDVETGSDPADTIPHPLIGAVKSPVSGTPAAVPISGWIHVEIKSVIPQLSLRALSFNVAPATNAETVRDEQLGRGTNQPGQQVTLAHGNVLPESIELVTVDDDGETHPWTLLDGFDGAGPFTLGYVLDPESGRITFGDGIRGRPPAEPERILVARYRHGGGVAGEVDVGMVKLPDALPSMVEAAVNIVRASGGKDAETQSEAEARAPVHLQVRGRAVTAEDFRFHALQAAGVRVKRAEVVPLRVPYPPGGPLTDGPVGLDFDTPVPGAVSVVVVPDRVGLYPTPTRGMLRTVCQHLDRYRLVTTEVYAVAPQYVRIFDLEVEIRAASGFTRTQLREAIASRLEDQFHVTNEELAFGSVVHHADLVAAVFRVAGVDRVESLVAYYDGNSPDSDPLKLTWRRERSEARRLTGCVEAETDDEKIVLFGDETVFIDSSSLNLRIV